MEHKIPSIRVLAQMDCTLGTLLFERIQSWVQENSLTCSLSFERIQSLEEACAKKMFGSPTIQIDGVDLFELAIEEQQVSFS